MSKESNSKEKSYFKLHVDVLAEVVRAMNTKDRGNMLSDCAKNVKVQVCDDVLEIVHKSRAAINREICMSRPYLLILAKEVTSASKAFDPHIDYDNAKGFISSRFKKCVRIICLLLMYLRFLTMSL
jgi:hypothetical protein